MNRGSSGSQPASYNNDREPTRNEPRSLFNYLWICITIGDCILSHVQWLSAWFKELWRMTVPLDFNRIRPVLFLFLFLFCLLVSSV